MALSDSTLPSRTQSPVADLHEDALRRTRAARHLAHLMISATFHGVNESDFERTLEVFEFLLGDVCASLEAMEQHVS